ncbi:hypothetical protein MIR68_008190 [Amoeboaphelidium protococcarum]|nr:hypothetical protein MIR68_008190 [Amoeboaphelidium protococcarum]
MTLQQQQQQLKQKPSAPPRRRKILLSPLLSPSGDESARDTKKDWAFETMASPITQSNKALLQKQFAEDTLESGGLNLYEDTLPRQSPRKLSNSALKLDQVIGSLESYSTDIDRLTPPPHQNSNAINDSHSAERADYMNNAVIQEQTQSEKALKIEADNSRMLSRQLDQLAQEKHQMALQQLEKQSSVDQKQTDSANLEVFELQRKVDALSKEAQENNAEIKRLSIELKQVTEDRDKLAASSQSYFKEIRDLEVKFFTANALAENLERELYAAQYQLQQQMVSKDNVDPQLQAVTQERDNLLSSQKQSKSKIQSLTDENDALKQRLDQLEMILDRLQTPSDSSPPDDIKRLISNDNDEIKQLQAKIVQLESDLASSQSSKSTESKAVDAEVQYEGLALIDAFTEVDSVAGQNAEVQTDADQQQLQSEDQSAARRFRLQLQKILSEQDKVQVEHEQQVKELKDKLSDAVKKSDNLLHSKDEMIQSLNRELKTLNTEMESLIIENDSLKSTANRRSEYKSQSLSHAQIKRLTRESIRSDPRKSSDQLSLSRAISMDKLDEMDNEALKAQIKTMEKRLVEYESNFASLQQYNTDLSNWADDNIQKLELYADQLKTGHEEEISRVNDKLNQMETSHTQLLSDYKTCQEQLSSLKTSVRAVTETYQQQLLNLINET